MLLLYKLSQTFSYMNTNGRRDGRYSNHWALIRLGRLTRGRSNSIASGRDR